MRVEGSTDTEPDFFLWEVSPNIMCLGRGLDTLGARGCRATSTAGTLGPTFYFRIGGDPLGKSKTKDPPRQHPAWCMYTCSSRCSQKDLEVPGVNVTLEQSQAFDAQLNKQGTRRKPCTTKPLRIETTARG